MLLLAFLLVSVVLADVQERTINNYVVKIDGNTLKSVQPTKTSSRVLDLSGLDLQLLEEDVFDNLVSVKNLNLGNNSLSSIPNGLFSKLGNLEHLSLADNNITKFGKSFEGLDHLKTLNISNNPLTNFEGTDLSGLPKSSVIFTKGLSIESINAYVFEKEPGSLISKHDNDEDHYDDSREDEDVVENDEETSNKSPEDNVSPAKHSRRRKRNVEKYYLIKICIHDDILKMVAPIKQNETLPTGCQRVNVIERGNYLPLENLGIAKFDKGWYQLEETAPIRRIHLSGNKIVEVTKELMNDLPSNVRGINLSRNKIERLNRGIIENKYISALTLDSNSISEIEAGALSHLTILQELYLNDNLLTDLQFAASLPTTMIMMLMQKNRITEITPGSFSRLIDLSFLYLDDNLIQEVNSNSLHGLHSLIEIGLANNRITKLEPRSFQQTDVYSLIISNNSIASFERDVFDHRSSMTQLDVSHNKLSNIKESFPDGLPSKLTTLKLDFNNIEKLERGNFKNLTTLTELSLGGNKISEIEPGSFYLPFLRKMNLDKNLLNELDINSFRGLKRLEKLSLDDNGISDIPKGFLKNMPKLDRLELNNNPIKRLQNGALYGFRRTAYNVVYLNKVPIEVVEGGLFDDM